jgi:hypothetical protein
MFESKTNDESVQPQSLAHHQNYRTTHGFVKSDLSKPLDPALEQVAQALATGIACNWSFGQIETFNAVTQMALGFVLPHDWTGQIAIVGVTVRDGCFVKADDVGAQPIGYQLYARLGDALPGSKAYEYLSMLPIETLAKDLEYKLRLIKIHAEHREHWRSAKLARLWLDMTRDDPACPDSVRTQAHHEEDLAQGHAMLVDDELRNRSAAHQVLH